MQDALSDTENLAWGALEIAEDGRVYLSGKRIALAPKEEGVLYLLLVRWPNSVTKDEFCEHVWNGRQMSDESLARCVARARRALGLMPNVSIKALYGQGYIINEATGTRAPVPKHQFAFHGGLMAVARAPSKLAETVAYCDTLNNLRTKFSLAQSEALLRNVISQDSGYIAAKVSLACCLAAQVTSGIGDKRPSISEGLQLLEPLVSSGSHDGVFTVYGHLLDCNWQFDLAESYHNVALRRSPNYALTHYNIGWHFMSRGNFQKAVEAFGNAHYLNPFSIPISIMLARSLLAVKDFERATVIVKDICELFPDSAVANLYSISLEAYKNPRVELIDQANSIRFDRLAWPLCNSNLAYIYARCGDFEAAWRAIRSQNDEGPTLRLSHLAPLWVLNESDEAFKRLEQAAQARVSILPLAIHLPENFNAITENPRGRSILAALTGWNSV